MIRENSHLCFWGCERLLIGCRAGYFCHCGIPPLYLAPKRVGLVLYRMILYGLDS